MTKSTRVGLSVAHVPPSTLVRIRERVSGARGFVPMPFEGLLPLPELCSAVSDLGECLRYRGALPLPGTGRG